MGRKIRYGAFVREGTLLQAKINYNDIIPKLEKDGAGNEIPYIPPKLKLRGIDIYHLITPYIRVRLVEQLKAVIPLAAYLFLFQLLILKQGISDSWIISGGLIAVIIGLMLFIEGLKLGLMPFGETIGSTLPKKSPLPVVLTIAFILGIGVTFAEPAIGALKAAGAIVKVQNAPYLHTLLNEWSETLVLVVGMGVGLATIIGTLRFINGWSLKPLIYMTLFPTLALTLYISLDPELSKILGVAWDCGAVTTGPVTVPLVLSLGIGIAAAAGKGDSSLSGFGIVTLASLFPIIAVLLLATYVANTVTADEIIQAAALATTTTTALPWYEKTPGVEIVLGLRAIVPLVIFLLLVMIVILRERIKNAGFMTYGITLAVIGMVIFNLGLTYGLAALGNQSGSLVPAAFAKIGAVADSPLYSIAVGIFVAVAFAWILGFGATLAEPALNALGLTVENLTNGAFRKSTLMYAVSIGVGCGIAIGVVKIIYNIPIVYLILPGYITAIIFTALSSEEFVNVAWDSAGVTTGPVTVPLVLAMGLGFGNAVDSIEGFGILSMASIGPIISVLATGLWIQWKVKHKHELDEETETIEATAT